MMAKNTASKILSLSSLLPALSNQDEYKHISIAGLTIDSRLVKANYLFVATKGIRVHGKEFVKQAVANGAVAILIDESETLSASVPVIKLANMEMQLSRIAGEFFGKPSYQIPVVGITGTNGKTTCSQLMAQFLALMDEPCGVLGTLGYGVVNKKSFSSKQTVSSTLIDTGMTTPDPISTQKICAELVDDGAKIIAMEVSSHGLSQHRIKAVGIQAAVFTNLTHDHLDYHGSMEEYGKAKAMLFALPSVKSAVINVDDSFSETIIKQLRSDINLVTFSLSGNKKIEKSSAHFSVHSMVLGQGGLGGVLVTPVGEYSFTTMLVGEFNIANLLAVISVLYCHHYSMDAIIKVIPSLRPIAGRMELIPNKTGVQVVIDFAHTPDALENALFALKQHCEGKLWCVFGCGGDRDRGKRPKMAAIAEAQADHVVLTSDNPRTESSEQIFNDIAAGFTRAHDIVADRASAINFAIQSAASGDVVLIAGKGHESYQVIGEQRLPFSDPNEARLSLRRRERDQS